MISRDDIRASKAPLACFATIGLGWGAFGAQAPLLKERIDASDGMFGVALLVAAFGGILAMWLAPRLDQWLGARTLPVLGLLSGVAFLGPGLAGGVSGFALGMLACSCSTGALDVVMNSRISATEAKRKRPMMNFAHAVFSIAYGISAISAGILREIGLTPPVVFGLIALFNIALVREAMRDTGEEAVAEEASGSVSVKGLLWLGGLVILIAFMAEQATEGWSALHLERTLGAGAAQGAMGPAILGITMAIGRLGGQLAIKWVDELRALLLFSLMAATGAYLAATANSLPVAYAGFAVLGFGISVLAPMMFSYVGRSVSAKMRTAAISRISVIGYAGFFIGPPVMGFVSEANGLEMSFIVLAATLLLITWVLVPLLAMRQRRQYAG